MKDFKKIRIREVTRRINGNLKSIEVLIQDVRRKLDMIFIETKDLNSGGGNN